VRRAVAGTQRQLPEPSPDQRKVMKPNDVIPLNADDFSEF
jgi:hypothetical protein